MGAAEGVGLPHVVGVGLGNATAPSSDDYCCKERIFRQYQTA